MERQAAAVTALSAAIIIKICRRRTKKKRRSRRVWVKPWLLKKKTRVIPCSVNKRITRYSRRLEKLFAHG